MKNNIFLTDWNYLRALNDIDKINLERKERVLSRVKWVQRYIEMLQFYSCCAISDAENDGLMCQVHSCISAIVENNNEIGSKKIYYCS